MTRQKDRPGDLTARDALQPARCVDCCSQVRGRSRAGTVPAPYMSDDRAGAHECAFTKIWRAPRERLELVKKINELRHVGASKELRKLPCRCTTRATPVASSLWCFLSRHRDWDQLGSSRRRRRRSVCVCLDWGDRHAHRNLHAAAAAPDVVSDTALDIQSAVDTAALDAARKRPPPPRKMPFPEAPPPPLPAPPVTGNSEPVTGHAVGEGGGGAAADGPTSGHALG